MSTAKQIIIYYIHCCMYIKLHICNIYIIFIIKILLSITLYGTPLLRRQSDNVVQTDYIRQECSILCVKMAFYCTTCTKLLKYHQIVK